MVFVPGQPDGGAGGELGGLRVRRLQIRHATGARRTRHDEPDRNQPTAGLHAWVSK